MELLGLLENRVQLLITEVNTLRIDNKRLQEELMLYQNIIQDKQSIGQELLSQQSANMQNIEHIEKLIKLIQDALPE